LMTLCHYWSRYLDSAPCAAVLLVCVLSFLTTLKQALEEFTFTCGAVAAKKSSRGGSNCYQLVISGLCAFVLSQEEM